MSGAKTPAASRVVMTESVRPGDGNPLGTAFGGDRKSTRLNSSHT